jgi:hypothetical protein
MTDQEQQQREEEHPPAPTPLEMARTWAGRVHAIAAHYEQREREEPGFGRIEAHVQGAGRQQFEAAQMAAYMAAVSVAEDIHHLVKLLGGVELGEVPPWVKDEPDE